MAFSKKNKRKITVNDSVNYWFYKFEKDSLKLTVMTDKKTHSKLICNFSYKELNKYFWELVKDDDFHKDKGLLITPGVLTPYVVRQVIDLALETGWKPYEKGNDFVLNNIEHKIDINFWTETTTEERKSKI